MSRLCRAATEARPSFMVQVLARGLSGDRHCHHKGTWDFDRRRRMCSAGLRRRGELDTEQEFSRWMTDEATSRGICRSSSTHQALPLLRVSREHVGRLRIREPALQTRRDVKMHPSNHSVNAVGHSAILNSRITHFLADLAQPIISGSIPKRLWLPPAHPPRHTRCPGTHPAKP